MTPPASLRAASATGRWLAAPDVVVDDDGERECTTLLVGWGAWWQGFPQFSELGWA